MLSFLSPALYRSHACSGVIFRFQRFSPRVSNDQHLPSRELVLQMAVGGGLVVLDVQCLTTLRLGMVAVGERNDRRGACRYVSRGSQWTWML